MASGVAASEEEGCVVVDHDNADDKEEDQGFLELGSDEEAILDYLSDAECSSPHEDELMGNALEALPELHSPAHEENKYALEGGVASTSAEDEETVMDAISKRTRAHYSLADMTMDQLETFLQESDEDDYFHNVDDEEEYRKFLAAVAQPDEGEGTQVVKDDEDEDDEDFELEIEEMLESDTEQSQKDKLVERRPETREKRREKMRNKERPLGFTKNPLRPLVPYHVVSSDVAGESSSARRPESCFSAAQIGQLHSLIHEHVQLLVQVFSLCILEPSRQQVAIDTHRMLMELVSRRDSASFRKLPFPDFCFRPPFIRPSVDDRQLEEQSITGVRVWCPFIAGPVHSVLSVAPLDHVKEFLDEVAVAVQEFRQRHVQTGASNTRCVREPLFPLPDNLQPKNSPRPSNQSQVKKSLAALLVENTKKQVIALVPKGIVAAAQRFLPFFNPALYPHKPPPAATANRLLFTDAEDELLAMGLMAFNTDWNAIQQRFLPTKTNHQIFVRQKNRSSSRAPENSIKAVRRMKNSSLTVEEKETIQEALKCFKYDWNKVWQHAVPHRDPALLPRQWRTAIGTQKSYKSDEASKTKRRLHEASKRRMRALQKNAAESQEDGTDALGEVTNSDDDGGDCDDTHIHQAFIYDWRVDARVIDSPARPTQGHSGDAAVHPLLTGTGTPSGGCSSRKRSRAQTIRLAPGLPSLNLPPHVRVISRSSMHSDAQPGNSRAGQHTNSIHPLLLQPTEKQLPAAIRPFPSYPQPAFHPFFGAKSSGSSESGSASQAINVHPLLRQPHVPPRTRDKSGEILNNDLSQGKQSGAGMEKVDSCLDKENSKDIFMNQEELSDAKDETEDCRVQFECEEMGDSDKECSEAVEEKQKEEIEFEVEDIDSESESMSGPAPAKESSSSAATDVVHEAAVPKLHFLRQFGKDNEIDTTAMEAAHVLAVIHQNAPEFRKPF
ncbi:uncharacterized protein LOC9659924 [Selaginella moellendorffii]|uniref:uncharacterized protein LOC9659924 n=1 Tax=Selaginella moellendorffii TaxID=88036 RepID=UPI000D1D02AA|nr:uncharacterized protein LOC9659924 [Selaginella moellendorffii]|eukprot:XP_002964790.2 uncharacterized protein LOC9659924 [Selaginella moellendorffii]